MKRNIFIAFLLVLLLLTSCDRENNFGYPYKVTFGREGGTKICSGTDVCGFIEIANYNGNGTGTAWKPTDDSIKATYDWLTVKCKKPDVTQLVMTTAPNHTGKRRRLYVYGMVDNHSAEIKVVQH